MHARPQHRQARPPTASATSPALLARRRATGMQPAAARRRLDSPRLALFCRSAQSPSRAPPPARSGVAGASQASALSDDACTRFSGLSAGVAAEPRPGFPALAARDRGIPRASGDWTLSMTRQVGTFLFLEQLGRPVNRPLVSAATHRVSSKSFLLQSTASLIASSHPSVRWPISGRELLRLLPSLFLLEANDSRGAFTSRGGRQ